MKTKLYSYIRFSSMRQNDGSSYERQIRMAREIAAKYDLELVNDYQDLGVSAFKGANSKTGRYLVSLMQLVDPFLLVAGYSSKTWTVYPVPILSVRRSYSFQ